MELMSPSKMLGRSKYNQRRDAQLRLRSKPLAGSRRRARRSARRGTPSKGLRASILNQGNPHTLSQHLDEILEDEEPSSLSSVFGSETPTSNSTLALHADGGVFASHGDWTAPDVPTFAAHLPSLDPVNFTKSKKKLRKQKAAHRNRSKNHLHSESLTAELKELRLVGKSSDALTAPSDISSTNAQKFRIEESGSTENVADSPARSSSSLPRSSTPPPEAKTVSGPPKGVAAMLLATALCDTLGFVTSLDVSENFDPLSEDTDRTVLAFLQSELSLHVSSDMLASSAASDQHEQSAVSHKDSDPAAGDFPEKRNAQRKRLDSSPSPRLSPTQRHSPLQACVASPPISSFAAPYSAVSPEPLQLTPGVPLRRNLTPSSGSKVSCKTDDRASQASRQQSVSTVAGVNDDRNEGWVPTSKFWDVFGRRLLTKWVWECIEENPLQESCRKDLIMASVNKLPGARMWIAKALAEVSCDHLETFLRDLAMRRRGSTWTLEAGTPTSAQAGCRTILGRIEDGSVLAEILEALVSETTKECAKLTADSPPHMATWLTAQLELAARTLVNLTRTRPILDSFFDKLNVCICQMVSARPHTAIMLLKRFLAAWPSRDGLREVSWLKLTQTILLSCPAPIICGSPVRRPLFAQIIKCLSSDHAGVARTALEFTANMYILLHYILPFPDVTSAVNGSLVKNRSHWCNDVRTVSEQQFDQMLDYQ